MKLIFFQPNMSNAACLMCIQRSCRCVVRMSTTNADSSLRRRRRSEFREFQDRHSNHCGDADERMSGNYGQTAILSGGGVHILLYLYTGTRVLNCHYIAGNGGQIGCRVCDAEAGRVATCVTGQRDRENV